MNQETTLRVVVPLSLNELLSPHRPIFDALELNPDFVMETCLYAWPFRDDQSALHDQLAAQMFDEHGNSLEYDQKVRENFDEYYGAIAEIMQRVRPHMLGYDEPSERNLYSPNGVNYIQYCGGEVTPTSPFFVAELHYVD